jgi:general secretion pathway protein I
MPKSHHADRAGFTLIEVLIALAIVSIALMAALRASGQGATNVSELRARLLAGWVAENRLAEHRARGEWLSPGIRRGTERQAGIDFSWREEVTATPNPSFRRVDIYIHATPAEPHVLAHLAGFVVQPVQATR